MAKENDLTVAYNLKVLAAIRKIGEGLTDLADALASPVELASDPEPRPARRRPETEPAEDPPEDVEPEAEIEVKLADLQKLANTLLKKKGGRPALIKILEHYDADRVSTAAKDVWPKLKIELEKAIDE